MTADRDPYVTLGLPRTASLDEVKRAYRRLAKANHPDAAGEAALPRFLAIQAAYDRIVGPANGSGGGEGSGGAEPARPWGADPARARATHRAYGGRSRRTRTSTGPAGPAGPTTGTSGDAQAAPGPGGTAGGNGTRPAGAADSSQEGSAGPAGAADHGSGTSAPGGDARSTRPPRAGRGANKATLGSTSYDGAEKEPFEPDWGGASWYGTTSGTYWTLNPKEYADPRKHGPEYQARARRGRRPDPADTPPAPETVTDAGPVAPAAEPSVEPEQGTEGPAVPPTHTATSWWEGTTDDADATPASANAAASAATAASPATAGPTAGPSAGTATDGATPRPDAASGGRAGPPTDLDAATASIRDWLDGGETGIVGRVGRAVIGWAPIALGIGWLAGEMTGCARFSASCDTNAAPVAWIVQLLALLLLVVASRLATIATIATAVTLAAAVPGTLILSATGGATDVASGRTALGGLLVIAWVAGIGVGIWRELRRRAGPGPVS